MTWALKRQLFYISVLIIFFGVFGYLIVSPILKEVPSCFDGLKNGEESGIDCGGLCEKACLETLNPVSVLWTRSFRVAPGIYSALAYLENHNKDVAVEKVAYRFRFADQNNVYLGDRRGVAYIPPGDKFAVFERGIELRNTIPVYTTFEFLETPYFRSVSEAKIRELGVGTSHILLENESISPSLSAKIKNNSIFFIPNIDVVAVLYGESGNAVTVSSSFVESLSNSEEKTVYFTWPEPFTEKIVKTEIIPMYDIFKVRLD